MTFLTDGRAMTALLLYALLVSAIALARWMRREARIYDEARRHVVARPFDQERD